MRERLLMIPISLSILYVVSGLASIGATVTGDNVEDTVLTMVAGGTITGLIAGFSGMFLCCNPDPWELDSVAHVAQTFVTIAAICAAPIVAKYVGYGKVNTTDAIFDTFFGLGCFITFGPLAVMCLYCLLTPFLLACQYCNRIFNNNGQNDQESIDALLPQ